MADKRVGHDFERQCREGLLDGSAPQNRFVVFGVDAFHGGHIHRRGEIIHDGVEQRLNALVLERGAGKHGHDLHRQRGLADGLPHLLHSQRFAIQILVHQFVVMLGDVLDYLVAVVFVKLLVDGRTL